MTGHGFRSAASSMLNECGLWYSDAIERQLAHVDDDSVRLAYHYSCLFWGFLTPWLTMIRLGGSWDVGSLDRDDAGVMGVVAA